MKKIYTQLEKAKQEFAEEKKQLEKVRLSTLNDITNAFLKSDKLVTNANKLADKIEKAFNNYTNLQEQGVQLQKQLEEIKKQNQRLVKEATKQAKDFGIEPNSITEVKKINEMDAILERTVNLLIYPSIR